MQCEDERFELDMVIEAGSSATRLLEPMEEEINSLEISGAVRNVSAPHIPFK